MKDQTASNADQQSAALPRRRFLRQGLLTAGGLALTPVLASSAGSVAANQTSGSPKDKSFNIKNKMLWQEEGAQASTTPAAATPAIVISTWNHGMPANEAAWKLLEQGGSALDAAEAGVRVPEADPESMSVGYGGLPDRDGRVTLDACIMDHEGRCGGVCFLEGYMHAVSVARQVMEKTPHVLLAGKGAEEFAAAQGFERMNLLTPKAKAAWQDWLKTSDYKPPINAENHDTIGLLSLDKEGRLAGACTTSGLSYKMHGRVGDSPIIGAGLYVDGAVGGATATGMGEMVIKVCGSFLVVELMRQGASPQEACEEAVKRIAARQDIEDRQVGFLALNRQGQTGAYAIRSGFNYALTHRDSHAMYDAGSLVP